LGPASATPITFAGSSGGKVASVTFDASGTNLNRHVHRYQLR
jgi:hypothetical protein